MADGVFNAAKGRVNELVRRVDEADPANAGLVVLLLKVAEADGTLEDYDDLAALLAGSNTEADFTSYVRIVLGAADVSTPAPDDTNNWMQAFIGDQTWSPAGGASNNTLVKLLVCYDADTTGGADSALIPLTHHDFAITTNGSDLLADEGANGIFRAA